MINRQYIPKALVLVLLGTAGLTSEAFTLSQPSITFSTASASASARPTFFHTSTFLRAEEENGEAQEESDPEETKDGNGGEASDILSSPAFLKRKVDVLTSDIEAAEAEIDELKQAVEAGKAEWGDQLDKLQSEYKNIQERLGNQNKKGDTMATVQVVREMLDVLDNYDRAFGAVSPETDNEQAIQNEFRATYDEILSIFESFGVSVIETVGKEFDYEYHQAVMQKPSDEYDEGIVCEELQKGFVLDETLIRASMVVVAV